MNRPFADGDRVLLVDNKRRRHLITLATGAQFHTHAGIVEHDAIIGHDEGIAVRSAGKKKPRNSSSSAIGANTHTTTADAAR